jgi:D-alanine-D-alanine ligase
MIVGVLRGGTSPEYDLSLKTGAAMLSALPEDKYDVRDIFIDKRGTWNVRGIPMPAVRALSQIDIVLNALHGGHGEDGTVQRILDRAGVAYAGADALGSAMSLNKARAKETLRAAGVRVPLGVAFSVNDEMTTGEMARKVFGQFGPPYIVKPTMGGASVGLRLAMTLHELAEVLGDVLDAYKSALVEEYVRGQEASVGVIEHFRNEDLYALPPGQVLLPEGERHVQYEHHVGGQLRHVVPSNFTQSEKRLLMSVAKSAHRALGLKDFSRADLILTPRTVYLLEVNTVPGLYQGASLPPMLESVGSSTREFLEHGIGLARR